MARHGTKKFDRWEFRIEARVFAVDIYIIRPREGMTMEKTRFRAVNKELELRIENTDIDVLRRESKAFVEAAGKSIWERWIRYNVDSRPIECERGLSRVGLEISWTIIERTGIGTPGERWRDVEKDGTAPVYGRIDRGEPPSGYAKRWNSTEGTELSGAIPYSKEAIEGLQAIASGMEGLYAALGRVLNRTEKNDPAKWLAEIARSGTPMLPSATRTEGKKR